MAVSEAFLKKNTWIRTLLFSGSILLLASCSQAPAPAPVPPAPQAVVAALSPAAAPLEPTLRHCAAQTNAVLYIEIIPLWQDARRSADLYFRLGEPPELPAFAAPVAEEQIVLISSGEVFPSGSSESEIRQLYEGRSERPDSAVQPVQTWHYAEGNEIRAGFEKALWETPPTLSLAFLAPGPAEMRQGVGSASPALGYLPRAWLDESVQVVETPETLDDALRLPVLALADSEPAGAARAILHCLQSGAGKERILEVYPK